MIYNKTLWENEDIITAEKLNNIEDNIELLFNKVDHLTEKDIPIVGDGITDDTLAIEQTINNSNGNIIFPANKKFLITRPIVIERDNITIDFNNSTLLWNGTDELDMNNYSSKYYGAITFRGKIVDGSAKVISSIRYNSIDTDLVDGMCLNVSNHNFNVGDFIEIEIATGKWSSDYSDYKPVLLRIARVVKVNGNNIYTDCKTPYNFDQTYETNDRIHVVRKVNPIKNIVVKNLVYKDLTPDNFDFTDEREKAGWVGALSFHYPFNFKCENIQSHRYKFPSIMVRRGYIGSLKNISGYDKSTSGGGLGYIAHILKSVYINVENIYGENVSPVIDFLGSAYCSVRNGGSRTGLNTVNSNTRNKFTCHGDCEHDILFENCHGNIHFGNGTSAFPVLIDNITLKNCHGFLGADHVNNLYSERCTFNMGKYSSYSGKLYGTNIVFNSCDIILGDYKYTFKSQTRGYYKKKVLKFINCNIDVEQDSPTGKKYIHDFAEVIFDNCRCSNSAPVSHCNLFYVNNVCDLSISNSNFINLGFWFENSSNSYNHYRISSINNKFIRLYDKTDCGNITSLGFADNYAVTGKFLLNVSNCYFTSVGLTNKIRSIYFSECTKKAGSYINIHDNYFNNCSDMIADRLSGCILNTTNNIFISCSTGLSTYTYANEK